MIFSVLKDFRGKDGDDIRTFEKGTVVGFKCKDLQAVALREGWVIEDKSVVKAQKAEEAAPETEVKPTKTKGK